jgi:hypothetical protein
MQDSRTIDYNFRSGTLLPHCLPGILKHYPTALDSTPNVKYKQLTFTRFSDSYWKEIWERSILVLESCASSTPSMLVLPNTEDIIHTRTYFYVEHEFMGIPYRVKIDEEKCSQPLTVRCGDMVDINGTNTYHGRYIVDTCQLVKDGRAYLPVHYRQYYGQYFTNTYDLRHPSFILEIPARFY